MHLGVAVTVLALGLTGRYLPEHARGGRVAELSPELLPPTFDAGRSVAHTLDVPLDHFNASNTETLTLRYFTDSSCWDSENGPIFVEMGGEGACGGTSCGSTHRAHSALAVSVEHRYYGESQPAGGRTDANLQFLTVEQNLADTAAVAEHVQATMAKGKRRALMNFGGSYSGATSAWFRQTYPNVTMAAVSSSGVVNAILNFTAFDEQVAEAIDLPTPGCADRLRALTAAFERIQADADADAGSGAAMSWDDAKRTMLAPNLVGTPLGDADFWYALADGAAMADQYGHKASLCAALAADAGDADAALVKAYSKWVADYWGSSFMSGCFYDSECFKKESWADSGMSRSWRWQKCTQLAYLQPGYRGSLRHEGLSLQDLVQQCTHVFGDALPWRKQQQDAAAADAAVVDWTKPFNERFGGDRPTGTKIFFSDFSDDPWRRASIQSPLPEAQQCEYCLEVCNGCGHCGAGVPPNVTHCADAEAAFVSKMLQPGHVEEWLAELE